MNMSDHIKDFYVERIFDTDVDNAVALVSSENQLFLINKYGKTTKIVKHSLYDFVEGTGDEEIPKNITPEYDNLQEDVHNSIFDEDGNRYIDYKYAVEGDKLIEKRRVQLIFCKPKPR